MGWMEQAPIWIVGLIMVAGLALVHELGARAGRRLPSAIDDGEGRAYLVSSALALLGLMLAFTFGAAEQRFNVRQRLVVDESNAMGTAYLRIQLLDPPVRDTLSREILRYGELRLGWPEANNDPARLDAFDRESGDQQTAMWRTVGEAVRANKLITLNGPLIDPINEMFDMAEARSAAQEARVPLTILRVLAAYAFAAAAIMGFGSGTERRHDIVSTGVLVLLTLAFCLILDLDRPHTGSVRINQGAMERTVAVMRQSESVKRPAAALKQP